MNGIPPIYIFQKQDINDVSIVQTRKIVIVNKAPAIPTADTFTQLFLQGGITIDNIVALNGLAFATLLRSDGHADLKKKLFITQTMDYDVDALVPEQIVFLTMFHHFHCLNYLKNNDVPTLHASFANRYKDIILSFVAQVLTQRVFTVPTNDMVAFFNGIQNNLIEERHHVTFFEFLDMFKVDPTAFQEYLEAGARRFQGNNNSSVETLATHMTSNTRRGLDRISNPTFSNNEENDNENAIEEPAIEHRSVRSAASGSVNPTGAPSNYAQPIVGNNGASVSSASSAKSGFSAVGTIELGNVRKNAKVPAAAAVAPPAPPAPPAPAPVAPPAPPAPAPAPVSKGQLPPALASILKAQAKTRKRARFPKGNLAGVVEYTYNSSAPPSGIITNLENVQRGKQFKTYQQMKPLGSRKKSSARPEPVAPSKKKD